VLFRKIKDGIRTTPGKLNALLVFVVAASLVFGVVGAIMVSDKKGSLNGLVTRQEPVTTAGQQLYQSFADADATAAELFLVAQADVGPLRKRYDDDIAVAGKALAIVASDPSSDPSAVQEVSQLFPRYTGLVQEALTNNTLGFNVGVSFLSQASGMMRQNLMPDVEQKLYGPSLKRLYDQQKASTAIPVWTILVVVILLIGLIIAQLYVRKLTNRTFNVGLAIASIATVLAVVWGALAIGISGSQGDNAAITGAGPDTKLADVRIAVVKARANEVIGLLNRTLMNQSESGFTIVRGYLDGSLKTDLFSQELTGQVKDDAEQAYAMLADWYQKHTVINQLNVSGDNAKAIELAVGDGDTSTRQIFTNLDKKLNDGIDRSRVEFHDQTLSAARTLNGLDIGIIVLALLSAGGGAFGLLQRLREYR
jgi:hypothetical protein